VGALPRDDPRAALVKEIFRLAELAREMKKDGSNTLEEASLALLTAQLDNLTTEIAQLAVGSTLDVALYSFLFTTRH